MNDNYQSLLKRFNDVFNNPNNGIENGTIPVYTNFKDQLDAREKAIEDAKEKQKLIDQQAQNAKNAPTSDNLIILGPGRCRPGSEENQIETMNEEYSQFPELNGGGNNSDYVKLGGSRGGGITPFKPTGPTTTPVEPEPTGIIKLNLGNGAIRLTPSLTLTSGYTFPSIRETLFGKPTNTPKEKAPDDYQNPTDTDAPDDTEDTTPGNTAPVITDRATLLNDLMALSPINPVKGGPIYSREQLDVPALDMDDLKYIRRSSTKTLSPKCGDLDDSNACTFSSGR